MLFSHPQKTIDKRLRSRVQRGRLTLRVYRGIGSSRKVYLLGRVFRQFGVFRGRHNTLFSEDLRSMTRLMLSWAIPRAILEVRFGSACIKVKTDRAGFFFATLSLPEPVQGDNLWHAASITMRTPRQGAGMETRVPVYIAPDDFENVIISDIDDTVIHTGVAHKIKMVWRILFFPSKSRSAFPGVSALYRGFFQGASGNAANPMIYLSRSPWAIYDVLDTFFNLHGIPEGPVLFLRYWGLSLDHPLPSISRGHKLEMIRKILSVYDDKPFILIGDSGQKDPEIYTRIVKENRKRVKAVYIRDVSPAEARDNAIYALGEETKRAGCALVLAENSRVIARHAARNGFISKQAAQQVTAVCRERKGA